MSTASIIRIACNLREVSASMRNEMTHRRRLSGDDVKHVCEVLDAQVTALIGGVG